VEILPAAYKHHVEEGDINHAYDNCLAWVRIDEDPLRFMLVGPDRSGNLLELIELVTEELELVYHAMPLRRSTEELFGGLGI
jgi:hypothetical protein